MSSFKYSIIFTFILISSSIVSAVLNGDVVTSKPYYARITYQLTGNNAEVERGGAIITDRFVLTLGDSTGNEVNIRVHVGSAIRAQQSTYPALTWLRASEHPGAPGLIQLATPLAFTNRVRPIRMIGSNQLLEMPGVEGMVLGMTRPPMARDDLRAAYMRVTDQDNCALNHPTRSNETFFCAFDGISRSDFCPSDRGSPFSIITRGQEFLVGLAFEGVCQTPAHIRPSLFIRLAFYRNLLDNVINGITENIKANQQ